MITVEQVRLIFAGSRFSFSKILRIVENQRLLLLRRLCVKYILW